MAISALLSRAFPSPALAPEVRRERIAAIHDYVAECSKRLGIAKPPRVIPLTRKQLPAAAFYSASDNTIRVGTTFLDRPGWLAKFILTHELVHALQAQKGSLFAREYHYPPLGGIRSATDAAQMLKYLFQQTELEANLQPLLLDLPQAPW